MNELPLRDIHLPDVSLWWPPAAGWWLLVILATLALVYLPRMLRWWRLKPVKKLSLRELKHISNQLKKSNYTVGSNYYKKVISLDTYAQDGTRPEIPFHLFEQLKI